MEEIKTLLNTWSNIFIPPTELTNLFEAIFLRDTLKSEDRTPLHIFFYDIWKYIDTNWEALRLATAELRKYKAMCYFFADKDIDSIVMKGIKGNIYLENIIIEEKSV
jgi:hypothetical protein